MQIRTMTSKNQTDFAGYNQAVLAVYASPDDRMARALLLAEENYSGVRQSLDDMDDDFYMSRPMVTFYLGVSPGTFRRMLKDGPHPFEPRKGAKKGVVDAWFKKRLVGEMGTPGEEIVRWGRDLNTGRPYLVTNTGVILSDAQVSHLRPEDVTEAVLGGAGIRIMNLQTALAGEWADPDARKAWAGVRMHLLGEQLAAVEQAMGVAREQDMDAEVEAPEPDAPSRGGGRL